MTALANTAEIERLLAQLTPTLRAWVLLQARQVAAKVQFGPMERQVVERGVQQKLASLNPKIAAILNQVLMLEILTEASLAKRPDGAGGGLIAKLGGTGGSLVSRADGTQGGNRVRRDIDADLAAYQSAVGTIARMHAQQYNTAMEILKNLKA
ncbi:MAG TPA: hypothetical protein VGR47_01325 [Terracidiphilus sp.]|nr:hypothetical protein [Terracidiphilus sp.]